MGLPDQRSGPFGQYPKKLIIQHFGTYSKAVSRNRQGQQRIEYIALHPSR
jgi:hypothetical protein